MKAFTILAIVISAIAAHRLHDFDEIMDGNDFGMHELYQNNQDVDYSSVWGYDSRSPASAGFLQIE